MDKNKAIITYLRTCPLLTNSSLFFNFGEEKDNIKQLITTATDKTVERPYIDGSVLKRYTFTIIDYKAVLYQELTNDIEKYPNENVQDILDVQGIIDWIDEQDSARNFPDFGDECTIDEITALTDSPNINGVNTEISPNIAKYSVAIRVQYLDKSKCVWNK